MAQERGESSSWAPRFFSIWTAQAINLLGSQIVQFSLVWWLTEKTGSATVLAMAVMAAVLPAVVVGPVAGALVDRWNRRWVMAVADTVIAASTAGLALVFSTGNEQVWHIYAALLVRTTAEGFHWPAMQASTSLMVPRQHLSRIAGLNQTLWGAMNIVAPPLGALLLGLFPLHGVLVLNICTGLIAVSPLLFLSVPQPERSEGARASHVLADFAQGLSYIWGWKGMFIVLVAAMILNLAVSPTWALLPLLVTKHFAGGVLELGLINSAWGIGVTAGGVTLSAWGGFRRRILTSVMGLFVMGLGLAVVGFSPPSAFWLAMAGMFVGGFMESMAYGPLMAIIQAAVAPDMQGRVLSLVASMAMGMIPIGMLIAGPVSDVVGVQAWYLIGGSVCALVSVVIVVIPEVMNVEAKSAAASAIDAEAEYPRG